MAAPALGIGDMVNACTYIYDMCMKYKDAPKEFDEIAEKSKSTAVVLERIDIEAKISGNLVDRAGPQGYEQLEDNLKSLRKDSEKLKALVTKYDHIHDEGAGRRLLFTFKESNGLTDLRRRIGLHEQMLQLWYMTLVYGSLRRLEGGQEDILRAIEAIKNWPPKKVEAVRQCLRKGNIKPLEQELRKSGLKPEAVEVAIGTAVDYVDAPPREKVRMESQAKSGTTMRREASSYRPTDFPQFAFHDSLGKGSGFAPGPASHAYRSRSSDAHRPRSTFNMKDEIDVDYEQDDRDKDKLYETLSKMKIFEDKLTKERLARRHQSESRRDKRYQVHNEDTVIIPADSRRPRRSSGTANGPPRSPFLVVPDTGPRHRPVSYHSYDDRRERSGSDGGNQYEEQDIIVQDPPRRHRSSSRRSHRSNGDRRDASTHSYTRRRSTSRGKEGGGAA